MSGLKIEAGDQYEGGMSWEYLDAFGMIQCQTMLLCIYSNCPDESCDNVLGSNDY